MLSLAGIYEFNSVHKACINLKAELCSGLGVSFKKGVPEKIQKFFDNPNNNFNENFSSLCVKLMIDYQAIGRFALEVVRGVDEFSLYHIPAHEIYAVQDGSSIRVKNYLQQTSGGYFKPFKKYNPSKKVRGSSVLTMEEYSPTSRFYGIPEWMPAKKAIIGNDTISDYMLNFFENNARPDYFIIITGTTLTTEQRNTLETNLRLTKGVDNAHKLVTLTIGNPNAKIEIKEMSKIIDDNFRNTKIDNRDEIALAHKVPPKILGISSAGSLGSGNEAIGALKILVECVIKPMKKRFEEIMNKLLQAEFGFDKEIFEFKNISLVNEKDLAIIHKTYIGEGIMSINEARKELGKPELDGEEYDKVEAKAYNKSLEINPDDMTNIDPTKDDSQTNE